MAIDAVQSSSGISANNVPGAVKVNVLSADSSISSELFYGPYPKDTIDITTFSGFYFITRLFC